MVSTFYEHIFALVYFTFSMFISGELKIGIFFFVSRQWQISRSRWISRVLAGACSHKSVTSSFAVMPRFDSRHDASQVAGHCLSLSGDVQVPFCDLDKLELAQEKYWRDSYDIYEVYCQYRECNELFPVAINPCTPFLNTYCFCHHVIYPYFLAWRYILFLMAASE